MRKINAKNLYLPWETSILDYQDANFEQAPIVHIDFLLKPPSKQHYMTIYWRKAKAGQALSCFLIA